MESNKNRLFVVCLLCGMCINSALMGRQISNGKTPVVKMEELLNDDGTLKPVSEVVGNVDPEGYVMILDKNGAPRFRRVKERPKRSDSGSSNYIMGDESWSSQFGLPGVSNYVEALAVDGTDIYVGGRFQVASNTDVNFIAKWDGSSWSTLGDGLNGYVYAIAPGPEDTVYVGGAFSRANPSLTVNYVAMWDGSSWNALGSGTNNEVYALALDADTLYAGGAFTTPYPFFAKWNGSSWESMGSINNEVHTILLDGSDIYIGGAFTSPANRVAKYTEGSWTSSGDINDGIVKTLVMDGSDLYAGGSFTNPAYRVALLNAGTWGTVGTGANNNEVSALLVSGSDLYAVGSFTDMGGVTSADYLARWNGSSWAAVGDGIDSQGKAIVETGNIFVGGAFDQAGSVGAGYIAEWNGSSWSALATSSDFGTNSTVNALAVNGSYIYAGGDFTTAGDVVVNNIARWDGSSWEALGTGLNGTVYTICSYGPNVYVGGNFSTAGGVGVNNIAVWNGASWSALGTGGVFNDIIFSIAVSDSGVFIGGKFTEPARRIVRFYNNQWDSLGTGIGNDPDHYVRTIAIKNDTVYAGGYFTIAGGFSASNLAFWDGTNWAELGGGVSSGAPNVVNVLAFLADTLYVGGLFSQVNSGALTVNNIARWVTGSGWSVITDGVEDGVDDQVWDIDVSRNYIYVCGDFWYAGDTEARQVAKFNGSSWETFGTGTDDYVYSQVLGIGDLFIGGLFIEAGSKNAFHFSSYAGESPTVFAEARVFLEGAYNSGSMTTYLYTNGYIPTTSPYSEDSRTVSSVPANATDWVLMQLRATASGTEIISKSIFLRDDGYIINENSNTQITLDVPEGNYYIVIKHRNHLGVMSSELHNLRSGTSTTYDFTSDTLNYYGEEAADLGSLVYGMFAGDANGTTVVNSGDYLVVKSNNGSTGYYLPDVNLTGVVNSGDYLIIKPNSGKETNIP